MAQFFRYPASGGASANASVGTNGAVAPTSSTQVAGQNPSGDLQPLQTNAAGDLYVSINESTGPIEVVQPDGALLHVTVDASALPTGAATEATLASIDGKIDTGSQLIANSISVAIASDQVVPVSASSLPLPTGAATEATLLNVLADTNDLVTSSAAIETSVAAIDTSTASIDTEITSLNTATLARLSGSLVPTAFDQVDLTYVTAGNGIGQIETATYKLATVTVKTLTLSYDSSNRLSSVIAS